MRDGITITTDKLSRAVSNGAETVPSTVLAVNLVNLFRECKMQNVMALVNNIVEVENLCSWQWDVARICEIKIHPELVDLNIEICRCKKGWTRDWGEYTRSLQREFAPTTLKCLENRRTGMWWCVVVKEKKMGSALRRYSTYFGWALLEILRVENTSLGSTWRSYIRKVR